MSSKKDASASRNFLAGVSFGRSDHIPVVVEIALANITPDPNQPRKAFDAEELENLASSIQEQGLIQPITVRISPDTPGRYIIVSGERRFRAVSQLGWQSIGCLVTQGDPAEIGLIENMQRVDLNPIEEAEAISILMEARNYTHETVAKRLGKSRVSITETLSFLRLPSDAREKIRSMDVKRSALRQLVRMDAETQAAAVTHIEGGGTLTARDAEALKKRAPATPAKLALKAINAGTERLAAIEGKLKIDEVRTLREAKAKLDEAYKMAITRK